MDLSSYRMKKGHETAGPSLYDLKWNGFSFLCALLIYHFGIGIPPDLNTELTQKWMTRIFLRNFLMMCGLFSTFHWYFYQRPQHKQLVKEGHKFNAQLPNKAEYQRDRDYTIYSICINSLFEIYVWKYQSFNAEMNTLSFVMWLILLPFWRDFHFFVLHRLFHSKLLYQQWHAHHHRSKNPAPWTGLSMHPVESIAYFTGTLLPLLFNLHPLHYLYANIHAQIATIPQHLGYDLYGGSYFHYLHHAKLNCNYGTTLLPLDILTDSWRTE